MAVEHQHVVLGPLVVPAAPRDAQPERRVQRIFIEHDEPRAAARLHDLLAHERVCLLQPAPAVGARDRPVQREVIVEVVARTRHPVKRRLPIRLFARVIHPEPARIGRTAEHRQIPHRLIQGIFHRHVPIRQLGVQVLVERPSARRVAIDRIDVAPPIARIVRRLPPRMPAIVKPVEADRVAFLEREPVVVVPEVHVHRDADLPQVRLAQDDAGLLFGVRQGWEQQRKQQGDDADDDE